MTRINPSSPVPRRPTEPVAGEPLPKSVSELVQRPQLRNELLALMAAATDPVVLHRKLMESFASGDEPKAFQDALGKELLQAMYRRTGYSDMALPDATPQNLLARPNFRTEMLALASACPDPVVLWRALGLGFAVHPIDEKLQTFIGTDFGRATNERYDEVMAQRATARDTSRFEGT